VLHRNPKIIFYILVQKNVQEVRSMKERYGRFS